MNNNTNKSGYITTIILSLVVAIISFVYAAVNLSQYFDALEYPEVQFAMVLCGIAVIAIIVCAIKLSGSNTKNDEESIVKTSSNISEKNTDDELIRYKKLLDQGIITQEEFEQKKKQLLDL